MNNDGRIKSDAPSVGALIVAWNRRDDLLECIDSLAASGYPSLTIYVVDNASTDGTAEAVEKRFPEVRLIKSEVNLGFAGGNNLGLAAILVEGHDAAFLVNDDAVVEKDCLTRLVDAAFADPDVGVTSPKIVLHGNSDIIWSAGGKIDPETGIAVQRHYGEIDCGQADLSAEVDYAVGCAMLVKSQAIRLVGLLDQRFFTYYEEADWCRRIAKEGYRILYLHDAVVRHKVTLESNGRNQASYYFSRNRLLYLRCAGKSRPKIAAVAAFDLLRSAAIHALKGRRRQSRLITRGVLDYYSNTFGQLRNEQ